MCVCGRPGLSPVISRSRIEPQILVSPGESGPRRRRIGNLPPEDVHVGYTVTT
jgi:hypothetical protein